MAPPRMRRQLNFLQHVLKEANQNKRKEQLQHANADQINAVSEMVLNTLRGNIPVHSDVVEQLRPHQRALRTMGSRRLSLKKRRQAMLRQKGRGFWRGLHGVLGACCCRVTS